MKATLTSIELKSPFKFFALSRSALDIIRQLKGTDCVEFRKKGFWTKHYTMSLWKTEADMQAFARSGAHLEAMKKSGGMAKEIRTLTIEAEKLPDWKTAIAMLEKEGKAISFS